METFTCTQHGCEFEAEELPENCPVCNNPQTDAGTDEPEWEDLTVAELRAQAEEWGLSGYSSLNKAELIDLLEVAEADAEDPDDDDPDKAA